MKLRYWALGAVVLLAILVRLPFLETGRLDGDEAVYAQSAVSLLEGGLPYRDVWDHKPPGVYVTYAVAFAIFGQSAIAIGIIAALFTSATVLVVFALSRHLFGTGAGYCSAVAMALFSGSQLIEANGANIEIFMALPLSAMLLVSILAGEKESKKLALLGGVLGGIAFDFKAVAAITMLAVPIYWFWLSARQRQAGWPRRMGMLAVFGSGFCLVQVGVGSYFAVNGALRDLLDQVFLANFTYVGGAVGQGNIIKLFLLGLLKAGVALLPLWVAAGISLIVVLRTRNKEHGIIGIAVVFSLAGALVGLKGYGHYFYQPLPFLAVATGSILTLAYSKRHSRLASWLPLSPARALFAVLAIGMLVSFGAELTFYFVHPPLSVENRLRQATEYVELNTSPDDTIFVWGSEPTIYFFSRRASPTRYFYMWLAAITPSGRKEIMEDLERQKPRLVLAIEPVGRFPELERFLNQQYVEATQLPILESVPLEDQLRRWLTKGDRTRYLERQVTIYEILNQ